MRFDRNAEQIVAMVADRIARQQLKNLDSVQTQALERQLTEIKAEIIRAEFGPLKALRFIPLATGTPAGAHEILYTIYTPAGLAKVVANYADDIPVVTVAEDEFGVPVFTVAASYLWTWLDLERASLSGFPLTSENPRACREAIGRKIDEILLIGLPQANCAGFFNHPNVPTDTVPTGNWADAGTSTEEILNDLFDAEDAVISRTLENHYPDTLVLPGQFAQILNRPRSTTDSKSIWQTFTENSQLASFDPGRSWTLERSHYADTAGSGGDPVAVLYEKDPSILVAEVPLEYSEEEPQRNNLSIKVPAVGRVACTVFKRPLACSYLTNLGAP